MLRLDGHGADEEDQEEDVEEGEDVVDGAEAAVFLIVKMRERVDRAGGPERDEMVMTGNIGPAAAQSSLNQSSPLLSSVLIPLNACHDYPPPSPPLDISPKRMK